MKDFAKSIRTGNSKELTIIAPNGEKVKAIDYDQWHYKCVDTGELVEKRYSKVVGNSKVGNGSGSWHGRIYEDDAGNSASVEKRGQGYEVYWEDYKGFGKPLGTYTDERTAKEVAEAAVESEMPDRVRANYKSKAVNSKVGNSATFDKLENAISAIYTYYYSANRQLESSSFSATNCINALSHIKQACDEAIKLSQQYDREINK